MLSICSSFDFYLLLLRFRVFCFFVLLFVQLVFPFSPSFFLGAATAAALKSVAAVAGNRKDVADRVTSLQGRPLSNRDLENYAADRASALWYEYA